LAEGFEGRDEGEKETEGYHERYDVVGQMTIIEQSCEVEPIETLVTAPPAGLVRTYHTPAEGTANCGPGMVYTEV
jgi:hypothetical protein